MPGNISGKNLSPRTKLIILLIVVGLMVVHYVLFPPDPGAESLRKDRPVPILGEPVE